MLLTGKIEVFKNKRGYLTGVCKAFEDKKVIGKAFIDVVGIDEIKDAETLTINVKEGYLNVRHVDVDGKTFDKFEISVKDYEVLSAYPKDDKVKAKR